MTISIEKQLEAAAAQVAAGQYAEAESGANSILEQQPKNPYAHYVLGLVAYMRKQYPVAIAAFTQATQYGPKNSLAFGNLGESLRRSGEPEKALVAFKKALELQPNFLIAQLGIANCLADLEKYPQAQAMYQKIINADPKFAPAYHYLGTYFIKLEKYHQALPMLKKAIALREKYPDALLSMANLQEKMGNDQESAAIYQKLLDDEPDNVAALVGLGNLKKVSGQIEEANEHFEHALRLAPDNVAAQYSLSHSKKALDVDEIDELRKQLDDPNLQKDARRSLHFTLGKYYDDLGDCQQAFDNYKAGNDMDDRIDPYNADAFSKGIDRMIEFFNEDFFKKHEGWGSESDAPVFIVGMPRSGTTLTEQTLASHSKVFGAGELKNMGQIARMIQEAFKDKKPFPACLSMLDPISACNFGERYVNEVYKLAENNSYARITDKMPGNSLNLGLVALLMPRAKIIHTMRDPMDSCFSCYSHNFASVISYSRKLEDLARHYRDYRRLMDHWHKVLPIEIFDLRYEDMVADHEGMARKLIEYCGLEWEDACLAFDKTERKVKTASLLQVRKPIYGSSVSKWRRYETQLQPLYDALGDRAPRLVDGIDVYS